MALDPDVSDNTVWADLPTAVGNGELMLEPGTAEKCAGHVEDMLGVVVGVHSWVQQNFAAAGPVIAVPLVSAELLRTVFIQKIATEFEERMDRHRNILTNMGNTFVEAGKKYQATEHDSTTRFQEISFDNPTGTPPPGAPEPVPIPTHPRKPNTGSSYDSFSFGPEMGAQLGWETLYTIGESIDSQAVANAAGVWYWLSQTLDTGFRTLRSSISAVTADWVGQGSQSAILATQQYVGASRQLTGDMNLLGDLLVYTSGWLQQTKNGMPSTPEPPTATTVAQQTRNQTDLLRYQANFQTYYAENFTHATEHVVSLPQPDEAPVPGMDIGGNTLDGGPSGAPVAYGSVRDPEGTSLNTPNGFDPEGGGNDPTGGYTPSGENQPAGSDPASGLPGPENQVLSPPESPTELSTGPSNDPPTVLHSPVLSGGSGGGSSGRGGFSVKSGSGGPSAGPRGLVEKSKLFPRAVLSPEGEPVGRAGPGNGRGSGFPLGGVPGATKNEEKERKKSEYLNSGEYLAEALGGPGRGVKPVLDR
ncbi:hypothetical protein [Nocardia sp. NPDC005366]|uniref:hypothetical protein n=1 Tax=Nocardia sp. NPDC005366 TaxID=3156878 RepID=UPI0033B421E4